MTTNLFSVPKWCRKGNLYMTYIQELPDPKYEPKLYDKMMMEELPFPKCYYISEDIDNMNDFINVYSASKFWQIRPTKYPYSLYLFITLKIISLFLIIK